MIGIERMNSMTQPNALITQPASDSSVSRKKPATVTTASAAIQIPVVTHVQPTQTTFLIHSQPTQTMLEIQIQAAQIQLMTLQPHEHGHQSQQSSSHRSHEL